MILTVKVLGEIFSMILLTCMPLNIKVSLPDLIVYLENLISMDQDRCFFTVSFEMPTAVILSQCIGVGGCTCPNYSRMVRSILPSFVLRNKVSSSASATEAATNLKIPMWT